MTTNAATPTERLARATALRLLVASATWDQEMLELAGQDFFTEVPVTELVNALVGLAQALAQLPGMSGEELVAWARAHLLEMT